MDHTATVMIADGSPGALAFAAGYLAGMADRRFGTGTAWTIAVYMRTRTQPPSIDFLWKLEAEIKGVWPEGETPPSIADVLGPRH